MQSFGLDYISYTQCLVVISHLSLMPQARQSVRGFIGYHHLFTYTTFKPTARLQRWVILKIPRSCPSVAWHYNCLSVLWLLQITLYVCIWLIWCNKRIIQNVPHNILLCVIEICHEYLELNHFCVIYLSLTSDITNLTILTFYWCDKAKYRGHNKKIKWQINANSFFVKSPSFTT